MLKVILLLVALSLIQTLVYADNGKVADRDVVGGAGVLQLGLTRILNPLLHSLNRAYSYTYDTLLNQYMGKPNSCSFVEDMSETLSGMCTCMCMCAE